MLSTFYAHIHNAVHIKQFLCNMDNTSVYTCGLNRWTIVPHNSLNYDCINYFDTSTWFFNSILYSLTSVFIVPKISNKHTISSVTVMVYIHGTREKWKTLKKMCPSRWGNHTGPYPSPRLPRGSRWQVYCPVFSFVKAKLNSTEFILAIISKHLIV